MSFSESEQILRLMNANLKERDEKIDMLMRDYSFKQLNECKVFAEVTRLRDQVLLLEERLSKIECNCEEDDECKCADQCPSCQKKFDLHKLNGKLEDVKQMIDDFLMT